MKSFPLAMILALALGQAAGAEATHHGPLDLEGAWIRETLPSQPVAGGFLTITNTGTEADVLLSVTTPAAGRVEVHEVAMVADVMRMRPLEDGLPLPAGETVMLKPGGYHLMLFELVEPMIAGAEVEVTFVFAEAGEITLTVPVGTWDGEMVGHGHGDMHHD